MLAREMESSGRWLFRRRGVLPLLVLAVAAATAVGAAPAGPGGVAGPAWALGCLGLGLAGLAIRVVTVGTSAPRSSGRNTRRQVADCLNTTGPYSTVRHPLYLGNFLAWMAVALLPRSPWLPALLALVFWLHHERMMLAEERFLQEQFGAVHEEWARRTPAFVPRLRSWRPAARRFSWRKVLRTEPAGLLALVASLSLLRALEWVPVMGAPRLDGPWPALLAVSIVVFVTLAALKRWTRALDDRPPSERRGRPAAAAAAVAD